MLLMILTGFAVGTGAFFILIRISSGRQYGRLNRGGFRGRRVADSSKLLPPRGGSGVVPSRGVSVTVLGNHNIVVCGDVTINNRTRAGEAGVFRDHGLTLHTWPVVSLPADIVDEGLPAPPKLDPDFKRPRVIRENHGFGTWIKGPR